MDETSLGCPGRRKAEEGTYDLRQVQRVIAYRIEHQILQLVDDAEQVVAKGSHDGLAPQPVCK